MNILESPLICHPASSRPNPDRPDWLSRPVVRELVVSTPDLALDLAGRRHNGHERGPAALPGAWPGIRYLAAQAVGWQKDTLAPVTRSIVAPFSADPTQWAALPWRFLDGGEARFGIPDAEGITWHIEVWGRFMSG